MPAVLITTDIFNLGVFREPANHAFARAVGQEGDADGLFLVLQPIILTGQTSLGGLPEEAWRHPHLVDYFADPAPVLGADGCPVIVGSKQGLSGGKWPKPEEWMVAGVPVPFPPGTAFDIELELTVTGQVDPVHWRYQGSIPGLALGNQPLEGDPALVLSRADWPEAAVQSFIRPRIDAFAELNARQQAEVVDWLIAAVGDLRQAPDAESPKKLTPLQSQIRAGFIVGDPVFDPGADLPDGKARVALWRKRLKEVAGLAARLYAEFLKDDPDAPPGSTDPALLIFDPPAFQYGIGQLPPPEQLFRDVGGVAVREGSYHHLLWEGIKAKVARASEEEEAQVRQALARLYGMGERIRWLKARRAMSPNRFMTVDNDSDRLVDGFGTNAHSLAGQVFRIGDVGAPITRVEVRRFLVNGREPIWKPDIQARPDGDQAQQERERARLGAGIVDFSGAVARHAGQPFSVAFKADRDNPNGLVLYQPKLADLQPEPLGAGLELPRSLLDAATPQGRIEMPEGAERLVVEHPQRIGLLKTELLGGENLTRPSGRIAGRLKLRVRLVQRRRYGAGRPAAGGSPASYVYDVALAEALAEPERALIDDIVANGLGGRELRLLIPKQTGAAADLALTGTVKREPAGGAFPLPLLRVVDGADIDAIDSALKALPSSLRAAGGFAVHLVIGNLRFTDPFNFAPFADLPKDRTLVGLKEHFTCRVGWSADRLLSRLEAAYDPPLDAADPVIDHFASFNKLRVALQTGATWSLVTYPDAMAPLPTPRSPAEPNGPTPDPTKDPLGAGKDFSPRGPHYFYGLTHYFDRELDDGSGRQGSTARSSEEFRYRFVTQGGVQSALGGYVEHQYSARLAVAASLPAAFRLGHEVRHVGELSCEAEDGKTRRTVYLLGFSCDLAADRISLSFDPAYVTQVFIDAWSDKKATGLGVIDAYRAIYEVFAELKIALAAKRLHLLVEGWAFDNGVAKPASAEAPTFFDTMRPAVRGELDVTALGTLAADLTATINALLGPDFAAFNANIDAIRAGRPFPAVAPAPFSHAAWKWVDRWGVACNSTELEKRAHVVRAGLRITRDWTSVVDKTNAGGRYIPIELSQTLKDRAAWNPTTDSGFTSLAGAAEDELKRQFYVAPDAPHDETPKTPLFRRAAWLACRDRLAVGRDADFERELQVHFGIVTPYLSVPRSRLPDVETVSDLYYATFGFLPLRRHRDLPDTLVTQEYASWLCRLMQAILDGQPFSGLQLHDDVLASDAEAERTRVEKLIRGREGLAAQIVRLIQRVDDREEIDKDGTDPLYARVDRLIVKLDQGVDPTFRQTLRERFLARPVDFADLRGFGLAIFDPDSWSDQLYALRINKRIRESLAAPPGRGAPRNEADEFQYGAVLTDRSTGYRFVVDALDEASYDAEFTIEQNRYVAGGVVVDDHRDLTLLGKTRRLDAQHFVALRGDAQARTAEDVLEADLKPIDLARRYFKDGNFAEWSKDPAAEPAPRRQLEVNVVHFNPSWRVKDAETGFVKAWQYLLPSRTPPTRPTLLTPKPVGVGGLDPRQSEIWIKPGEDPVVKGLFAKRAAVELKARDRVLVDLVKEGSGPEALVLQAWPGYQAISESPPLVGGWQRYDTVLAHHYFLVDADADADVNDPVQTDAILIETAGEEVGEPPRSLSPRSEGLQTTALYEWFWWDRMRAVSGATAPMPSKKPTLRTVVDQLFQAFDVGPDAERVGPNSLLFPLEPEAAPERNGALFSPRPNAGTLKLLPPPTGDAVGYVVGAELMRVASDPQPGNAIARYAVRVTTLEAPLRRTRVRLRVLRNYRDVDADLDNDVAAAFLMVSPMAEWSERPDTVLNRVPEDFIAQGVTEGWILNTAVSRKDWLSIDLTKPEGDPSTKRDFGPMLREVIETRVAANSLCRLWGAETEEKGWRIHGEVRDANRDAHEVYAAPGLDRNGRVKRQNLVAEKGAGPVDDWQKVGELTKALDRRQIVSARFEITFVWSDDAGKPRMTVTLPVRFKP